MASGRLAARLLAGGARTPAATRPPPPGRVDRVETTLLSGRSARAHATVWRGDTAAVLTIDLVRAGNRWVATALR
jgi:hypothetical protein